MSYDNGVGRLFFYINELSYRHTKGFAMRLLKLKDVIDMTSLSKASIYRQVNAGTFPMPIRLGPRAVAWIQSELEAWIEGKRVAR